MDETAATRIGDADRNQVQALLGRAFSDGRITLGEFEERSSQAAAAVTRHDLDVLVADLPPGALPPAPAPAPPHRGAPGTYGPPSGGYPASYPPSGGHPASYPPSGGHPASYPRSGGHPASYPPSGGYPSHQALPPQKRSFVAVMSGCRAKGRWRVPPVVSAVAFWGAAIIDLREAEFQTPELTIKAFALMGGVDVIVPPGMDVDLSGFVLMGGATDLTRPGELSEGRPRIRVKASGMWGGVTVRTLKAGKRLSDPGEIRKAWSEESEADEGDAEDGADEVVDADRSRRGPHGRRRHGHGWPSPPPPPSLPRGLADILPPMPGPRAPAGRRRPPWVDGREPASASRDTRADAPPPPPPPPPPPEDPAPPAPAAPAAASPSSPATPASPATPTQAPPAAPAASNGQAPEAAPAVKAGASVDGDGVRPTGRVLTMLVSDIVDSTPSAVQMGDQRWMGVLATHDALFREQVRRHHGTEVKHQGDGFLVTFTSARQAVLAGIAIQRAMASHRTAFPENDLHVRLGIHTGEVVEDDGDIFGANVITAVRIAGVARPDEVLVSGLTRDLTESSGDLDFDEGREAELKGLARPSRVFAAAWG